MGSEDAEARPREQPIHTVYVDAFYMDTHEGNEPGFQKVCACEPAVAEGSYSQGTPQWRLPETLDGQQLPDGQSEPSG